MVQRKLYDSRIRGQDQKGKRAWHPGTGAAEEQKPLTRGAPFASQERSGSRSGLVPAGEGRVCPGAGSPGRTSPASEAAASSLVSAAPRAGHGDAGSSRRFGRKDSARGWRGLSGPGGGGPGRHCPRARAAPGATVRTTVTVLTERRGPPWRRLCEPGRAGRGWQHSRRSGCHSNGRSRRRSSLNGLCG